MKLFAHATRLSLALVAGLLLSACGGGDPYAGLWKGTIDGNREANAIVLGDGTYYMMYSKPGVSELAGVYVGTGDFQGARFTAPKGRDYNWVGKYGRFPLSSADAPLAGKLSARQSVVGSVDARGSLPFAVSYVRDLDDDARLSELAGSFTGTVSFRAGDRPAVFNVTATGEVSSSVNGCPINGKAVPRSDANAFDLTIVISGPPPCLLTNLPFKGVVLFHPAERRLEAAVVFDPFKDFRGQAIVFNGVRPATD